MKRKIILCVVGLVSLIMISCTKEKESSSGERGQLEGTINYSYYFSEDGMLISNHERIMHSDWNNIDFDYICTDPLCVHTDEACAAFAIDDKGRREDNTSFTIEYNEKLIIFERYCSVETEKLNANKTKIIDKYFTDVYEAELDGTNRKLKLTIEGITESDVMTAGVIVIDGQVCFGGPKRCVTIAEYVTDSFGNETVAETIEYDDAMYCVNLYDYTVKEYARESCKPYVDYSAQFTSYGEDVYYFTRSSEANTTSIYHINITNGECELVCKEHGCFFLIGALENTVYYTDVMKLYYRNLSDINTRNILDVPQIEIGINADVIGDSLVVMTAYDEQNGDYEIEYTFYNSNGKVLKKNTYNEYFVFWENIGDKVIFVKVFDERQMWWAYTDDIKNLLDNATYIGSYAGWEYGL